MENDNKTAAGNKPAIIRLIIGILILVILGVAIWFVISTKDSTNGNITDISQIDSEAIAATIGDISVTQGDISELSDRTAANAAQQGVDVTDPSFINESREQALEILVNTEILKQAAIAQGISASDDEVEARYAEIELGSGGAEAFAVQIESLGLSEEDVRGDLYDEIAIAQLLESMVDTDSIEVSDKEIQKMYDEATEEFNDIPALEIVRGEIESQIIYDKEQELVADYIEDLRKDYDVDIK